VTREVSLYLDICRFCAAAMVFLSHVAARQFTGSSPLWVIGDFGEDAVAVFFVLSGFVIAYVTEARETDARSYAVSRLARLYSVALPALVLTFLLDGMGAALRPDIYSTSYISYGGDHLPWRFFAGLLFINEIWDTHTVIGSNGPYWSLGFEAWYYVAFGLAAFAPARWRMLACVAVLAIAGPKIALLFPLWLAGLGLFHLMKQRPLPPALGWLAFLGGATAFLAVHYFCRDVRGHMFAPFAFTPERLASTLYSTALGLLFALHLIGFRALSPVFAPFLQRHAGRIRYVAGATFSLYLFHMPVMLFIVAVSPWAINTWPSRLLILTIPPAAAFVLSMVTERRKEMWRGLFERALGGTRLPRRAVADG
jgi:peptidoglycan/LPS O-acetylase OafA/YrhL